MMCGVPPRILLRNSFWNPFIIERVIKSAATPTNTPPIAIAVDKERNFLWRERRYLRAMKNSMFIFLKGDKRQKRAGNGY
jgi:hypothetical protein